MPLKNCAHVTRLFSLLLLLSPCTESAVAQERFELVAPRSNENSQVLMDGDSLRVIDFRGNETLYMREALYDSIDRQWLGYFSSRERQILRWPASGIGNLQIGQVATGGAISYRISQMTIRPLRARQPAMDRQLETPLRSRTAGFAGTMSPEASRFFAALAQGTANQPTTLQLTVHDESGQSWTLARTRTNRLAMIPAPSGREADWLVVPASRGLVRLHGYDNGRITALATSSNRSLVLEPPLGDSRQLWQVVPSPMALGQFVFESALFPGLVLGGGQGPGFGLHPLANASHQMWLPIVPPNFVPVEPVWRTSHTEIRPNPPLEPAQLELINSHRYALIVLVADRRRTGQPLSQVRIEPQSRATLTLDRDAGATLVETCEIRSLSGVWTQSQFVTPVPPTIIYDLSVYEEHLQSIAIDRTGTSPNPIEDVNYVPKSVGWLPVPPGNDLADISQMRIFEAAQAARNPGAVRRFEKGAFDKKSTTDPLDSILNEVQRKSSPTTKERRKL